MKVVYSRRITYNDVSKPKWRSGWEYVMLEKILTFMSDVMIISNTCGMLSIPLYREEPSFTNSE